MQKHVKKWLTGLIWNFTGLIAGLGVIYVAGVVVILQVSTRAVAKNPYFAFMLTDFLAIVLGIVAIWFVFRCIGKLYDLATNPPKQ